MKKQLIKLSCFFAGEAAPGFEPGNKGFAEKFLDIKLNNLNRLNIRKCLIFAVKRTLYAPVCKELQR
jgi:hypothetical protein